jgi:N-acetyl-beta-hexosaminidase
MIDTARHWYPVTLILQHLDAMAYNKFNGAMLSMLECLH